MEFIALISMFASHMMLGGGPLHSAFLTCAGSYGSAHHVANAMCIVENCLSESW